MSDGAANIDLGWESFKGSVGKFLQAGIGFLGTVVFARALGPVSFGGFYFLLSMIYIVDRPIRGVGGALSKRFAEAGAPKRELLGATLLINFAALMLVAVAMLLLRGMLESFTNVPNAALVFISVFGAIALFFPYQMLIAAAGMPARQTWNDTLRSILTFPLQLAFVVTGFGAAGMGYGLASATLLTTASAWWFVGVKPAIPTRSTVTSLWSFAKYNIPSNLLGKAYDEFDSVLLGAVLTTAVVGEYQAAFKLTLPAAFLGTVLVSGLIPKVSNLTSKGEAVSTDIQNVIAYSSLLAIPIFFGALALSEQLIVTAYGGEYRDGAILLVGLALYRVFESQRLVLSGTLKGMDRPRIVMRVDGIALAFNIAVGLTLVFAMGPIGVVLATVMAEAGRYVILAYIVRADLGEISLLPRPLGEQIASGLLMFGVVKLCALFVGNNGGSWLSTGLLVGIGGIVYVCVLFGISTNFRITAKSIYEDALRPSN